MRKVLFFAERGGLRHEEDEEAQQGICSMLLSPELTESVEEAVGSILTERTNVLSLSLEQQWQRRQ